MSNEWITVSGVVMRGHHVASRKSEHYETGTIEMQLPFFKERGLDLSDCYRGTINVSIAPYTFRLKKAERYFPKVEWTKKHPPEDFSFSQCHVIFDNHTYTGWIYYPHPETKIRHFQNDSLIEIIAPYIPGLQYGDRLEIELQSDEIEAQPS